MRPELSYILEATGYLDGGQPAPGVRLDEEARATRRSRKFEPDALWRGPSALTVYFKFEDNPPTEDRVTAWRREIWNEGFAPLLWVVSPKRIDLYNGFARPRANNDAQQNRLRSFHAIEAELRELDRLAGRVAMETGQFWLQATRVNRKTSVDHQLLSDLAALERQLVESALDRSAAQSLIGRVIFTQYLIDRKVIDAARLKRHCGVTEFPKALRNATAAVALFEWLGKVFNGDMFPASFSASKVRSKHLSRVADFLEAVDPESGQTSLFPYQFDIIPVELISSIYEQFAHAQEGRIGAQAAKRREARQLGVHYTRLPVVSLVLDEVMDGLTGQETVLDLTCGSGVFLVEALRRLVSLKAGEGAPRQTIHSILYNQIFGVDISEAAVRAAAFSLYLAAIELDPDPQPPEALKFKPLIGHTLIIGNARDVETTLAGASLCRADGRLRPFDVIVGNPPWTFKGKAGTRERRRRRIPGEPMQPRGEGLDFVLRAIDFSSERTRFGIVLSAMPFFAASKSGARAAQHVVKRLSPVTLVNLAPLTRWLFPTAQMPAMVLLARCRLQHANQLTLVNIPWSPAAERAYTFEIAPSDITSISLRSWEARPQRLKTAAFGRGRDLILLEKLQSKFQTLAQWLTGVGTEWRDGLILGTTQRHARDATHLRNLEVLSSNDLTPFVVPDDLPGFRESTAERPRERQTYAAPLLLIKEFLKAGPRPTVAFADRDLLYTDAYFGVSLGAGREDSGRLLATILSSSLASWFFLMTASEFGVWKRRLLTRDVGLLPIPDPAVATRTHFGRELLRLEESFRLGYAQSSDLNALDIAVFDLYGLDEAERIVVADGHLKAGRQWEAGRELAAGSATIAQDLKPYVDAFLSGLKPWLDAAGRRQMRAQIFELPASSPLRVVRFVLEARTSSPTVELVDPDAGLSDMLQRIGQRLGIRLSSVLIGERELRIHGPHEVIIIKPAERRFWMRSSALEDADAVMMESAAGAAA